ncbi:hypothetical protein Nepgr_013297 [Nepenthes gracilis]|uniref:F-box domain-containing protein n=1 Tax=Nepenthes gracilis TaxID=150966 RepID=A0AAD3SJ86_NEPGR|nr:hypothetical protein Nepgr_013297 [Nepenthes gracilis]
MSDSCQQEEDYFDLLPDPILLLVFDKVLDAKSLCRCLLVSKRFASLIPQLDSISIKIGTPRKKSDGALRKLRTGSSNNLVNTLICQFIAKPLQFLQHLAMMKSDSTSENGDLNYVHWMTKYLKNFSEVRFLQLELPSRGSEIGGKDTPFLKWTAEFGKELQRCVILQANSFEKRENTCNSTKIDEEEFHQNQSVLLSNDDLKTRIIWIITCVVTASARHSLLKKLVTDCPELRNAVITDSSKQWKLSMKEDQIRELRNEMNSSSCSASQMSQRTCVPDLVMRLYYVRELELACSGYAMKGATLVAIRSASLAEERDGDSFLKGCLGGREGGELLAEAAREITRRTDKTVYKVEMSSF